MLLDKQKYANNSYREKLNIKKTLVVITHGAKQFTTSYLFSCLRANKVTCFSLFCQIEHIVLGKGPPGGSWHTMDPEILTLSLGSWMALPGLSYKARDGAEKRASAGNVARYYVEYAKTMNLEKNMLAGATAIDIRQTNNEGQYPITTYFSYSYLITNYYIYSYNCLI